LKVVSTMANNGDFKDPFNAKYFLGFLAVFAVVGCLNAILGWAHVLAA
jgi:hypothetical protein